MRNLFALMTRNPISLVGTAITTSSAVASVLGEIFAFNVFPEMNVRWGAYPNHIGHEVSDGCFRCHDDEHMASDDGRSLSQDCFLCHTLLAIEEEEPEILEMLQP